MKNRRGNLWATGLNEKVMQFKAGDIVKPVIVNNLGFTGVVREADPRINKVLVAWGDGSVVQHGPDEIQLAVPQVVQSKMALRRGKLSADFFVDRASAFSDTDAPKAVNLTASRRCKKATGEMGDHDIQPGGEYYGWAQDIEKAAKAIQRLSHNITRFREMLPFDVYRGPYAQMNNAKLWSGTDERTYFLELFQGGNYGNRMGPANPNTSIEGTPEEIADWLIEFKKKNASVDSVGLNSRRGTKVAFVDPAKLATLPRLSLSEIAVLVSQDWQNVNYAAKPYLQAMATLRSIKDNYMLDSGSSIVAYFVANSGSWRGEVAKAVKKELNRRLKSGD